jgi:starch synthase (maltosyl-transferring)
LRIYCVDTIPHSYAEGFGAALGYLEQQISRSAELGFGHFLVGAASAGFVANPAVRESAAVADSRHHALAQLGQLCKKHGLALLLDLAQATLPGIATVDPAGGGQHDTRWADSLAPLVAAGVDGFRCPLPASLPAQQWRELLTTTRERAGRPLLFLAWTPGLSPAQLQALSICGFDGVFSSLPWWDFRAAWLAEEQQRLRALDAVLINPLSSLAPHEFRLGETAARRLLFCAATCADGLLMPAGFEFGGEQRYDLSQDVIAANAWLAAHSAPPSAGGASSDGALSESASAQAGDMPAHPALQLLGGVDGTMALLACTRTYSHDSKSDRMHVPAPGQTRDTTKRSTQATVNGTTHTEPVLIAINPSLDVAARYPVERILSGLAPRTGAAGLIELPIPKLRDGRLSADGSTDDAPPNGEAVGGNLAAGAVTGDTSGLETEAAHVHHSYTPVDILSLAPGEVRVYRIVAASPVLPQVQRTKAGERKAAQAALESALRAPRIAIEDVQPTCDAGRFAVRRVVGACVTVEADAWMDGHDLLQVAVRWRPVGAKTWQEAPMRSLGNDRWRGEFALEHLGRYEFTVHAWHDPFATWLDEIEKKRAAGQDLILETEEGRLLALKLIEGAATGPHLTAELTQTLSALATALARTDAGPPSRETRDTYLDLLRDPATRDALEASGSRPFGVLHDRVYPVEAERLTAQFGSWYELFPRSQTSDPSQHGTFDDVIARMPAIKAMGFDVLYFPPIHPIGKTHRKGRNNTLKAAPDEPGSPYAIGSHEGGHDALHPELGGFESFERLLAVAAEHGLEIALDFAIQCSPDHPWLREHPEWFSYRPDGTVRYAENPPKKYQDIVNVDFYASATHGSLWQALRDTVVFWAARGVRIFRVDNPHTKPLPFWEWMIADVRAVYPDAIFLAEAFTRPKPMARLAKLGFSQSYTYFTWRNDKYELSTYLTELTQTPLREYFRPNFFVNTPDINPYFLHRSGRPGFLIRAALAALLSGLWGMYSGFELCESEPLMVADQVKEEYVDSEKFEIRPRDWQQPGNIVAEISRLNALRRNYPALRHHLGVRFYLASNDQVLYFARFNEPLDETTPGRFGDSVLLIAINLDPFNTQQANIELPLWEWGLPDDAAVQVEDLMQGYRFVWSGKVQQITLNPQQLPFAIWQVSPLAHTRAEVTL